MANILLIHGAAHGAWCWRDVIPRLGDLGHTVRAIDLPSHGQDPTPYSQVTLDSYADAILDALDEPAVVVAHSMGGYPATLAAERAPDLFQRLIYLCAYVPAPGLSLAERRMQAPRQPLLPAVRMTKDRKGWSADPALAPGIFYQDCPPETVAFALERLSIQATQPTSVPVTTGENYARVPRSYIRCMNDGTIPPEFQVTMTADWPLDSVHEMQCGHSPFFADPAGLSALIDTILQN
ncbi:alpha/beta fold hydrolase [Thalassovita sp.]|jgi:pimeloyl-ACP methyl ester carboxylesterase|uniref:alpha/beta fold hydrolase n=1 Tax=Thalassovita sp. TaxID=1979401 RepID=UPI003B5A2A40